MEESKDPKVRQPKRIEDLPGFRQALKDGMLKTPKWAKEMTDEEFAAAVRMVYGRDE